MRHINITSTCPIDNIFLLEKSNNLQNMGKTTSTKISGKASSARPPGKTLSWDKTLVLETLIQLYVIEYGDKAE